MKSYKNKKTNKWKIMTTIFIILLITAFTILSIGEESDLSFASKIVKDVTVFTCNTLYAPINFVKEKVEVYLEKDKIYKKYKKLEQERETLNFKDARIKELENENDELRGTLKVNENLSDYDKINATVISRNPGYWYQKLVIDKGSKDGIIKNMAVVNKDGLVGYTTDVSYHSSSIQLLSFNNMNKKISVKIELDNGEYATGLLTSYDSKNNLYQIEGISYIGDISVNSVVTTTGLSENFPSGVLLGYVDNITTDNLDFGKIVQVKPSVNFDNIGYVTILKRKAQTN